METQLLLKPYTTKELANMYGVSRRIFRNWLQPFNNQVGPKTGHYFTVAQVKLIFDKLGIPGDYESVT